MRSRNIPFVRVDISIRPFVRAFIRFIEHTNTNDAAIIFNSEKEQLEGIYEILNHYTVRTITYNGINDRNVDRILDLRPIPTNYAIIASTKDMEVLIKKVCANSVD